MLGFPDERSVVRRWGAGSSAYLRLLRRVGLTALILFCILVPASSRATRVRSVNLEEMTRKAGRIVSGRCVAVEVVKDPTLNTLVTQVTLEVDRAIKGESSPTLVFRMLGDATSDHGVRVVGLPRFEPEEHVILFLYGESRSGLTSPVGFGQGKFVEIRDKRGRPIVVNGFSNRTLFRGLSPAKQNRLGIDGENWNDRQGLPPDLLIRFIESLDP